MALTRRFVSKVVFQAEDQMTPKLSKMSKSGAALTASLAAIGLAAGKAVSAFARWEKKIAEVSTLVDTATFKMRKVEAATKDLAKAYGVDATQQATAFYQAISAGAKTAEAAVVTVTEANRLALGGVTDLDTAIDGLTTIVNAYSISAADQSKVTEQMFSAMVKGKTTVGQLSANIGQVASVAAAAGVSTEKMFAAVATLTAKGIRTETAVISLRQAISAMLDPSKEARDMAAQLGVEFNASAIQAKGFEGVLRDIHNAGGANAEVLSKLFGNIRAFNAVTALTADGMEKLDEVMKFIETDAGRASAAVTKMSDNFQFQSDRMASNWDALLTTLGDNTWAKNMAAGAADAAGDIELLIRKGKFLKAAFSFGILWDGFAPMREAAQKLKDEIDQARLAKERLERATTRGEVKERFGLGRGAVPPHVAEGGALFPFTAAFTHGQEGPALIPGVKAQTFKPGGGDDDAAKRAREKAQRERDTLAKWLFDRDFETKKELIDAEVEYLRIKSELSKEAQADLNDNFLQEHERIQQEINDRDRALQDSRIFEEKFRIREHLDFTKNLTLDNALSMSEAEIALRDAQFEREVEMFKAKEAEKARINQQSMQEMNRLARLNTKTIIDANLAGAKAIGDMIGVVVSQQEDGGQAIADIMKQTIKQIINMLAMRAAAEAYAAHQGVPIAGPIIGAAAAAVAAGVVTGFIDRLHTGGEITESMPRTPGLRSDERMFIGQVGETVRREGDPGAPGAGGGGVVVNIKQELLTAPSSVTMDRTNRDIISRSAKRLRRLGHDV